MKTIWRRFKPREDGATAIEYGLILSLMVVALVASLNATGGSTKDKWENVAGKVADASGN